MQYRYRNQLHVDLQPDPQRGVLSSCQETWPSRQAFIVHVESDGRLKKVDQAPATHRDGARECDFTPYRAALLGQSAGLHWTCTSSGHISVSWSTTALVDFWQSGCIPRRMKRYSSETGLMMSAPGIVENRCLFTEERCSPKTVLSHGSNGHGTLRV